MQNSNKTIKDARRDERIPGTMQAETDLFLHVLICPITAAFTWL
jgi:hypothetical protein